MSSPNWQKSSYSSEGNNCVELAAILDGTLRLRESDDPTVTVAVRRSGLRSLIQAAQHHAFVPAPLGKSTGAE